MRLQVSIKCTSLFTRFFSDIEEAIAEEKRIKGGSRAQEIALIEELNPNWGDLYEKEVKLW
ncbi:hypothetical protein [Sphingobacterium sp. T2]|uniref:hypothetical protein n=1 Tax=Sphingobacterium sp. T2 TaxID=1590596 RepID=UPI001E43C815|nr:hypothetical protein [Sphingobacterium sp. T2]